MICVSSHRPLKECSKEILLNQLRARQSWESNFDLITYFGSYETALAGDRVMFVPCETFPRISEMAEFCSQKSSWSAIVNADIVVQNMPRIQAELTKRGAFAAMSRRYDFDPKNPASVRISDNGLDFFAALPPVWKLASETIPKQYRIGHQQWDTWMMGFLALHYFKWLWDITDCRAVFHPKHEDRRRIFDIDQSIGREHLTKVQWPVNRLKI